MIRLYILPAAGFRQGGNVGVLHRCWLYNLLVDDPLCCEAGFNSFHGESPRIPADFHGRCWPSTIVVAAIRTSAVPRRQEAKPTIPNPWGVCFLKFTQLHPFFCCFPKPFCQPFCPSVGHCSCRCFGNPGVYGAIRVIHWRGNLLTMVVMTAASFVGSQYLVSQKPKGNRNGSQSRALPGYAVFACVCHVRYPTMHF